MERISNFVLKSEQNEIETFLLLEERYTMRLSYARVWEDEVVVVKKA